MQTQVQNISGTPLFFGFLPPHGKLLAAGATVVLPGDLRTVLASGRGRSTRSKEIAALAHAEATGKLAVTDLSENGSSSVAD